MSVIEQTPSELLDWEIDWSTRGLGTDTISSSTWSVSSPTVTLSSASNTTTTTTIFVTGGVAGNVYTITNLIQTSGGRIMVENIPYVCIPQRLL